MSERKEFICETWKQNFSISKILFFFFQQKQQQQNAQEIRYESAGSFTYIKLHFAPTETPFFIQFGG